MPRKQNKSRSSLGYKKEVRPGVWRIIVTSGYNSTGAPRKVSRTIHGSSRDADKAIAELAFEMGQSPSMGDPRTIADYWPYFMRRCEMKGLTKQTITGYEKEWRLRIEPRFGSCKWSELKYRDIQQWLYGMTHSQAEHCVRVLKRMINCAVDDELVERNILDHRRIDYPVDKIDPLAPRPIMWGAEQVAECMKRLQGDKIEPLWLVLVGGGLRVEEALALWWEDITFSPITHMDGTEGIIAHASITKAWTEKDGLKAPKNTFSTRIVPIPDPFASRLNEIKQDGNRITLWSQYPGRSRRCWKALFADGKPLEDLPYARLKDMRSIHETMLQDAGVLDTLNARIHGRTNVQTGYTHYLKPSAAIDNSVDALRIKMQNIG